MVTIEQFSDKYSILHGATAIPYNGDGVRIDKELYYSLKKDFDFPNPTLKLGHGHYEPFPVLDVLSDTIVVPEDIYEDESVLILNNERSHDIPIF